MAFVACLSGQVGLAVLMLGCGINRTEDPNLPWHRRGKRLDGPGQGISLLCVGVWIFHDD
jgi:hypothetical protein